MDPKRARASRPIDEADRSDEGRGRVAVVTGASAGIGLAFSELLAAKGYDIVPVARRESRLDELKSRLERRWNVSVSPLVADLSEAESPRRIADELGRRDTPADLLVNNAGYTFRGRFVETSWEDQERFMRVLALSAVELTHRLLPGMVDRGWGRVVNVCSISSLALSTPQSVMYSASKSMLHKLTEGLAVEHTADGINVTASMPGLTETEIFEASGWGSQIADKPWLNAMMMRPETVARQAYDAVMRGRVTVVHGWHHKLLGAVWLHAPQPVRRKLCAFTADISLDR